MGSGNGVLGCLRCHGRRAVDEKRVRSSVVENGSPKPQATARPIQPEPDVTPVKEEPVPAESPKGFELTGFVSNDAGEWDDKALASLLGGQPTKLDELSDVDAGAGPVQRVPVVLRDGSVYSGQWLGRARHGMGKHFAMDGSRYVGSFANDLYEGEGEVKYINGDSFRGIFKGGMRNGKGVMTYANGDMFDGNWRNNVRHGFGVERFADGSVYMGMFNNNKREGVGELKMSNGVLYEGTFDNDVTGKGRMVWPTGESYVGEFKNGYKHRYGVTTYRSGPVLSEKGTYAMGRMHGLFECVMRDGHVLRFMYKNGKLMEDVTNKKKAGKLMAPPPVPEVEAGGLVLVDELPDNKVV
ncbi:MORN repeat domain containing protein, putative [Babesia bigemina]|uniref:MORN repeat domain containing protein, putative n=1 Tax=Babesia bigemina TaxID=5866 RepID=A0A061DCS1_BABBI|nr:MORN repeat domain containing protein, putative [Babesia bigemina]CDR97967.1 MORN repeat domain containing protein, putative [Babesia bigemina]|eukprot:XP_012770153.1 MORN repeat domain containing protein, putative [Babesia bigemina]